MAKKHPKPMVPRGTVLLTGPLRIVVGASREDHCDIFVYYGTKGELGHKYNVDSQIILDLMEELEAEDV